MDSVRILGMRVDRLSMESTLARIEEFIRLRQPRHLVTADASMVVLAREDRELASIIDDADLVTPDGAGILWASRWLPTPITNKVSGVDLVGELSRLSALKGYRLFFLGSAPGVADDAARNLADQYPGAIVVGTRDGYFTPDEEATVVEQIKAAKPDVLFVAMGIPKQEKWIRRHKDEIGVPVSVGIGGSFDVYSGRVKRAPRWMQRRGLEWLYRVMMDPKKISKVMTLPKFAYYTIRQQRSGG